MSQQGLKIAAEAIRAMQRVRGELHRLGLDRMGVDAPTDEAAMQDIALANLLRDAEATIFSRFAEIAAMGTEKEK